MSDTYIARHIGITDLPMHCTHMYTAHQCREMFTFDWQQTDKMRTL